LFCLLASGLRAGAQGALFTNFLRLTNREATFKFIAPSGINYRIDAATNLALSNALRWDSVLTLLSTGVSQHTDSAAPFAVSRFYRAQQLSGSNILTGDNLSTTNGDIVFHPVNHASFVMSWNGKMIYNDPVGGATPYAAFPRADLILVSHDHSDHYDTNTLKAVRATNGLMIVPPGIYNKAGFTSLRSNAIALAYGASTNVMGLTVEAVPAYNGNHPYGTNNAYVITMDGRRILTSGDCGDAPEIRAVTNIDVAFICMNLPFTTNWIGATNIVRSMRPRVVYPYHYRDSGTTYTNATLFKQRLGTEQGIEVRLRGWY
jgi:L-ascorbate metabolism protein UlaG (beta-lactamase superfamily)